MIEDRNKALGFSSFGRSQDSSELGEIYAIYIAPSCWRHGLGQQLLTASEVALREDGYYEAILWVLSNNQRAIQFYQQAGWYPDKIFRNDTVLGIPVRETRYHKRLIFEK